MGPFKIALLCSIFFGVAITEACSVNLLPLTLAMFTENPTTIFLVLAINPAFGVIAQPIAGLWGDHVWTRFGCRAVFLIICAPLTALCVLAVPFMSSLVILISVIVALQFFQDMLNGTDQPMMAEMLPPKQRTFVMGCIKSIEQMGFMLALFVGMRLVDQHADQGGTHYGLPLYGAAVFCQFAFVMIPAFFLGEKPIKKKIRPKLSVKRYWEDFWHQPMLPRLAFSLFIRAFTKTAVVGSAALYASQTLKLSDGEFGQSWAMMPFIALLMAIPCGWVAERFAKQRVMQVAFGAVILSCFFGYTATGVVGFTIAAFLFGFGDILIEVTQKPFMSEQYPADITGQLAGAINVFFAIGRTLALIFMGYFIPWVTPVGAEVPSYEFIWIVSGISAIMGIIVLNGVRDFRHEARSAA